MSQFVPVSNQEKVFLEKVIQTAQTPGVLLDPRYGVQLQHPWRYDPNLQWSNTPVTSKNRKTQNSYSIYQTGGTRINQPTIIGDMPSQNTPKPGSPWHSQGFLPPNIPLGSSSTTVIQQGSTFVDSPTTINGKTVRGKGRNTEFTRNFKQVTKQSSGTQNFYKNGNKQVIEKTGGVYVNTPTTISTTETTYYNPKPGDVNFSSYNAATNTQRTYISKGTTNINSPVTMNYRKSPEIPNEDSSEISDEDYGDSEEIEVSMELSKEEDDNDPIDTLKQTSKKNKSNRDVKFEDLPPDVEIFSSSEITVDPVAKPEKYHVEIVNRTTKSIPAKSQYAVPKKYYSDYKKATYPKESSKNRYMLDKDNRFDTLDLLAYLPYILGACTCNKEKTEALAELLRYRDEMMVTPPNIERRNFIQEFSNPQKFWKNLASTNKQFMKKGYIEGYLKRLRNKLELPHMEVEYNPALAHITGFVN